MDSHAANGRLAEVNRRIGEAQNRLSELEEWLASGAHSPLTVMLIQATTLSLTLLRATKAEMEKSASLLPN